MQSQKERSQHAADQFHAAAVDGDVEDFELTVRSWAGPVAVPAGSATITAPEEAAAVSVHWAAIQTRNRTLDYRAPLSNRHGCHR
jgi:hypothetical protein